MTRRDPQSDVIEFLGDPATHGLGPGEVAHIRTHISDLFLADTRVYKTKRALRYAFVDFTTLESRRDACEQEVTLNRRTAPELYLGVVAIRRSPDGRLTLDRPDEPGTGTPVEWAVAMQRFDETQTLDHRAARGELGTTEIDALVDQVVALHTGAKPHYGAFGGAAGLAALIDENVEDMAGLRDILPPSRASALCDAARTALTRNEALLDARKAAGYVRRCHGDLHLGNAVLWRGRPVLFDCIEFSERIATIDIAYDLAFLLMDLEVRGLRTLANRTFGRYFGRMGGTDALAAMPLMLSLRAAVRAKVTAMTAAGEPDKARKQADFERANSLLDAAQRFLAPGPGPRLVAVGGLSGTGKTRLGGAFAPLLGRAPGALHVRSDVIRKRLADITPEQHLPPASYTPEMSRTVYRTMLDDAAPALAAGYPVVLDAVFADPDERHAAEELARSRNVPFTGLWLDAPLATLKGRVSARTGDASDATASVVERQMTYDTGTVSWHRIGAGDTPEAVLARARALIDGTS